MERKMCLRTAIRWIGNSPYRRDVRCYLDVVVLDVVIVLLTCTSNGARLVVDGIIFDI